MPALGLAVAALNLLLPQERGDNGKEKHGVSQTQENLADHH
jgi:hypothetical protein